MCYIVGNEDVAAIRSADAPKRYSAARNPLVALVEQLT